MSRDRDLDEFLARSEDVINGWQGSFDAMSVRGGSIGGTVPENFYRSDLVIDRNEVRAITTDHINRISTAFDVPREMLPDTDQINDRIEVQFRAQAEAYARAVDDTLFRHLAVDVADRIPDDATISSKDDAVEQVLRAAIAAGWRPPE